MCISEIGWLVTASLNFWHLLAVFCVLFPIQQMFLHISSPAIQLILFGWQSFNFVFWWKAFEHGDSLLFFLWKDSIWAFPGKGTALWLSYRLKFARAFLWLWWCLKAFSISLSHYKPSLAHNSSNAFCCMDKGALHSSHTAVILITGRIFEMWYCEERCNYVCIWMELF